MDDAWKKQPYSVFFRVIKAALKPAWSRETASPGCQAAWSEDNPTYGQCAVTTAFLYLGLTETGPVEGLRIMRAEVEGFGSHYWLQLPDGVDIDLTRKQFPDGTVIPPGEERTIEYLLDSPRAVLAKTRERMDLLEQRADTAFDRSGETLLAMGIDL